jgi:hypothetical protein
VELMSLGIFPVQAVRRVSRNEHVDDHQTEIADLVNNEGYGIAVDGPGVTASVIAYAARHRIIDGLRVGTPARV